MSSPLTRRLVTVPATWLATLMLVVLAPVALPLLAITSAVYYWRARTEEQHLLEDPIYGAYHGWMERHGPVTRLLAAMTRRVRLSR